MDDLLGEDWQQPAKAPPKPTPSNAPSGASAFASSYSSFRASPQLPLSGTVSPQTISRPSSTVNGGTKASGSDSFGGLLNLKSQKPGSNLSMQERQKQILEEKRKQQEQNSQLWDTFGSGRGTPEIRQPSPAVPPAQEDEDDILAAFNKDAPVDRASHLEMPSTSNVTSGRSTPAMAQPASLSRFQQTDFNNDDDDDPFGLNDMSAKRNGHAPSPMRVSAGDDDDILGDLGKPVTDLPRRQPQPTPSNLQADEDSSSDESDTAGDRPPQDRQLAELVEMGFPPDTARIALAENGGNVQNAVGWLLQQAHEESRQKARGESQQRSQGDADDQHPRSRQRDEHDSMPSWMRQEARSNSASTRQRNNGSPANGERDASQVAQEFGSKFLKSANTFWKASQKQVAKTLSEFQQPDIESSQPKWMREPELDSNRPSSQRREPQHRQEAQARDAGLTDEAAMLDAPRERPQKPSRPAQTQQAPQRTQSPAQTLPQRAQEQPQFLQRPASQPDKRPATRLSRKEIEEQTAQAYVSPARRRKATPKPEVPPEPEVDLFSPEPDKPSSIPAAGPRTTSIPARPRTQPATPRPNVPPRNTPSISPSALSTSASHRKAGGEHFKRGDFAAAHESYTAALTPLPATHPIAIIVLSNRALTALKTGDAKMAVSDADRALDVIGSGLGAGESIDLGGGEGTKDMKEFYGKALMRKAEALEHLEKYADAAATWRQAVAAGVGGAISLRGRDRCEKAAAPKPATNPPPSSRPGGGATKSSAPASRPPPTKSLGNSLQRPTLSSASSGEAVKKLRQANAAAEKADDEKFALTDQVDAKLAAWRGGKTENLRALLQSMDAVLWESAGWKKVGMSDLVMPNKVKIVYMKAIAKVHPDKIPQDATTEQRMISAAVFSTLNEAWDKFKKDNNL